jgi:hypothetical protein
MGGSGSKPAPSVEDVNKLSVPGIDISRGTFSGDYLQKVQQDAASALKKAQEGVKAQAGTSASLKFWLSLLGLAVAVFVVALGIALIYAKITGKDLPGFGWLAAGSSSQDTPIILPSSEILYVSYAYYGTDNTTNYKDVTTNMSSKIVDSVTLPSFVVGWSTLGLSADPYPGKVKTLYVEYYVGENDYTYAQASDGSQFPQLPQAAARNRTPAAPPSSAPVAATTPSVFSKLYNSVFGDSSGNLAPSYHDASTSVNVNGTEAPLSSADQGGYGMQWWMYVKDWNYGFGKKKSIVKRPDVTSSAVLNPHISLHPTENTLQVSVSIFPNTEGGASKSTPAPAGHSGSTDDVFVCEVPNIPLQTWFSVGVTVFGRNLDIYIDGKLVKSCFMTGVPKPAVGDIQLTPEGGFSGRICDFYHYPRMLTPSDATDFWNKGTSCRSKSESPTSVSKATGYSIKFGLYDALGKEVNEYAF